MSQTWRVAHRICSLQHSSHLCTRCRPPLKNATVISRIVQLDLQRLDQQCGVFLHCGLLHLHCSVAHAVLRSSSKSGDAKMSRFTLPPLRSFCHWQALFSEFFMLIYCCTFAQEHPNFGFQSVQLYWRSTGRAAYAVPPPAPSPLLETLC